MSILSIAFMFKAHEERKKLTTMNERNPIQPTLGNTIEQKLNEAYQMGIDHAIKVVEGYSYNNGFQEKSFKNKLIVKLNQLKSKMYED